MHMVETYKPAAAGFFVADFNLDLFTRVCRQIDLNPIVIARYMGRPTGVRGIELELTMICHGNDSQPNISVTAVSARHHEHQQRLVCIDSERWRCQGSGGRITAAGIVIDFAGADRTGANPRRGIGTGRTLPGVWSSGRGKVARRHPTLV